MREFYDVGFIYKPKRSLQINDRAWKITNMQREFTNKKNSYIKNRQLVILDDHVIALKDDGFVYAMGDDTYGQCGQCDTDRNTYPPYV